MATDHVRRRRRILRRPNGFRPRGGQDGRRVGVGDRCPRRAYRTDPAYAFALSRFSDQNLEHTVMGNLPAGRPDPRTTTPPGQVASAGVPVAHDRAALQALLAAATPGPSTSHGCPSPAPSCSPAERRGGWAGTRPTLPHPGIPSMTMVEYVVSVLNSPMCPVFVVAAPVSRCRRCPRPTSGSGTRFGVSDRCWRPAAGCEPPPLPARIRPSSAPSTCPA